MNKKLALSVLSTLLISACASEPAVTTAPEQKTSQTSTQSYNNNVQAGTEIKPAPDLASTQLQEVQEMQKKSVYFDRDEFTVKTEFNNIIQQQAESAKANRLSITLEGNADERGSSEYNLALGSKRANAVKKSLEIMGLPSKQIRTASFGEVKPRATCHEEKCWQENRRVDFNGKPDL